MIHRIYHLTTVDTHFKTAIHSFYNRLQVRGYLAKTLIPIFNTYIKQLCINKSDTTNTATQRTDTNTEQCVFLHMPFHPNNPPSSQIQRIFRDTRYSPKKEPTLTSLRNFSGNQCTIQRLIIAYNRPKNIGNYTSPRKLRSEITLVSTHLLTTKLDTERNTSTSTRSNGGTSKRKAPYILDAQAPCPSQEGSLRRRPSRPSAVQMGLHERQRHAL